jgi:hypothetical protein
MEQPSVEPSLKCERAAEVSGSVKHIAFFDMLGEMSESDPNWRGINAGLQVLRLVDTWLAEGRTPPQRPTWGLRAVRAAMMEMSALSPARQILGGIADAIEGSATVSLDSIAPRLMAYGRSLEYDASWSLAADVYGTIIQSAAPGVDADFVFDAHMRLGYCRRRGGNMDGAEVAYANARAVATVAGDHGRALHSRVGEAALARDRGNLPLAESTLDEIIAAAAGADFTDVRALALHDRSTVAYSRGQNDEAVRLAYTALQLTHSLTARDRILNDLGAYFVRIGALDAARDAFLVLAATAQEQHVRWLAMINLLEVAALRTNEPMFEQNRRDLIGERMAPALEAQYHYHVALGYHAFGKLDAGLHSLARARELAEAHQANQLLFQIDELVTLIKRGVAAAARAEWEAPADLCHVIDAVSEMRVLAGV